MVYYVAENETVPTYVPPDREGFIFDGWNPNYTATVTADTIFTAKWREHISDGYTVTYTDGVDSEEIFPDMVYEDLSSGDATPAFEGNPTREGFTFAGWNPEVAATVTGDATYTAQWTENAPAHTHDYTAVVTEPTCNDRGFTTYTCSCNDSYVSDYVDALGHAWEDWQNNHDGTHMRICKRDRSHSEAAYCSYEVTDIGTYTHELTCPICGDSAWNDHEWVSINGDPHAAMCTVCKKEAIDEHAYIIWRYDGTNHWLVCGCGQGLAGSVEAHTLVDERNNNAHWQECMVCNYYSDAQAHVYSNDSDETCNDCGYNRHVHSFSTATCAAPATCTCGRTFGFTEPNNHTGGTEIRNAAEATIVAEGYTGDTYCLGCGSMIASGEVIPKAGVIFDGPGVEDVTFIPAEGTELPEDAEIIVNPHTPSVDNLAYVLGTDADTEYLDLDDEQIIMYEIEWFSITYEGVTYKMGEYIIIDGLVYFISSVASSNHSLHLIRTDNKSDYILELGSNNLINNRDERRFDLPTNKKVSINGITYDVKCIFDTSGGNSEGREQWMLYYGGEPVGTYFPSQSRAVFYEGYDPEPLKAQKNASNLGTVTPGENPIDGLESGKTYNVSVIGSNDIHLEGAENVSGTVTQTFDIPVQLVNNPNVKYVAVHVTNPHAEAHSAAVSKYDEASERYRQARSNGATEEELALLEQEWKEAYSEWTEIREKWSAWEKEHAADTGTGNELGTVTIAEDGKTLTATYEVDSFSPFIVYAFVEADEPEIKTITTLNITDESTPQAPAPAAEDAPGSPIFLWITLMSLTAIALLAVVIVARKRSRR